LFQRSDILLRFKMQAAQSRTMLKTTPNFALLAPVKIRGWVGEISIPVVKGLPTTDPPKYILWPSTEQLLVAVD